MTIQVKVPISKMRGQYDPEKKLMTIQGGALLRPMEMNHINKSGMVFKTDPNHGTILVPVDEMPTSDRELLENVYHGEAFILKPRENSKAEEKEPTILVIKEGDSHKEVSFFLQEPQTICGEAMIKTDHPNLYVHILGEQQEPLLSKIRSTGLEGIGKVETLAAHITSNSVHNIMNTDNTVSQVSLELCNSKRG